MRLRGVWIGSFREASQCDLVLSVRKVFLILVALAGWAQAEQVQITSPLPLPITGNISASFTPPAVTTVTFNGVAQPVTATFNPPAITTVTFNGIAQPVTGSISNSTVSVVNASGSVLADNLNAKTTTSLSSATINTASTGDQTIIAGSGSQTIRVMRLIMTVSAATNLIFKNGASGFAWTGAMSMTANGSIVLDYTGEPWYVTSTANGFIINQSGTAQMSGTIWYTQS